MSLLVGITLDEIVDVVLYFLLFFKIAYLECFSLDESDNFLKGQLVGIEFTVKDNIGWKPIKLGDNVFHVRDGLAKTGEESSTRNADATGSIQFGLGEAGKGESFAAFMVFMSEHGQGNFGNDSFSSHGGSIVDFFLDRFGISAFFHFDPGGPSLGNGLLDGCGLVFLSDVFSLRDDFFADLHLAIEISAGNDDDT